MQALGATFTESSPGRRVGSRRVTTAAHAVIDPEKRLLPRWCDDLGLLYRAVIASRLGDTHERTILQTPSHNAAPRLFSG